MLVRRKWRLKPSISDQDGRYSNSLQRVLFISNGHGEDTVGAHIALALRELMPHLPIEAFPIVGKGSSYSQNGFTIMGPTAYMPSGGFLYQSLGYIIKDIASGLIGLTIKQLISLKSMNSRFTLAIGVGDSVPLFFNSLALRTPMIFVGVARSARYKDGQNPYSRLECNIMRKWCKKVFTRDPETQDALSRDHVAASYVGNPMMDYLETSTDIPDFLKSKTTVGILPGSRDEAYTHIRFLLPVLKEFAIRFHEPVTFAFALANTLDFDLVLDTANQSLRISGTPVSNPSCQRPYKAAIYSLEGDSRIVMAANLFAEVLAASTIIIGLSGTGNEQAAGMGRPIIIFPGDGPQITERFVRKQKKLLGGALSVTRRDPEEIMKNIKELLLDPKRREAMGREGRRLMEGKGSCHKIAEEIKDVLKGGPAV